MVARPGRAAANAAPVTPFWSIMRGSVLGVRTADVARTGIHLLLGVPRRNTEMTVPV